MKISSTYKFISFLTSFFLAGCGDQLSSKNFYLYQKVQTKNFEVVVNSAEEKITLNQFTMDDIEAGNGNKFIVINVTVKNISNEGKVFEDGKLVTNYDGKVYEFTKSEKVLAEGFSLALMLNPMISWTGNLAFIVPSSIDMKSFYWSPDVSSVKIYLTSQENKTTEQTSKITIDSSVHPKEKIQIPPSFSCSLAATPTEKSICISDKLSLMDSIMVFAYKSELQTSSNSEKIKIAQANWRQYKRDLCGGDSNCLTEAYNEKLSSINSDLIKDFMAINSWALRSEDWKGKRFCSQEFTKGSAVSSISYYCAGGGYNDLSLTN